MTPMEPSFAKVTGGLLRKCPRPWEGIADQRLAILVADSTVGVLTYRNVSIYYK